MSANILFNVRMTGIGQHLGHNLHGHRSDALPESRHRTGYKFFLSPCKSLSFRLRLSFGDFRCNVTPAEDLADAEGPNEGTRL